MAAQQSRAVGFEARGFIFGPPLALALNCAFVPLRKPGKLPGTGACTEWMLLACFPRLDAHIILQCMQ